MTRQEATSLMRLFEKMSQASTAMNQYQSSEDFNRNHDVIGRGIHELIRLVQDNCPQAKLYHIVWEDGKESTCDTRDEARDAYHNPHVTEIYSVSPDGSCHTIAMRK